MEGQQSSQPYVTLNDGTQMPQIGLGTFQANKEGELQKVVKSAILEHGYRHIDTAHVYKNQVEIGKALKECFEAGIKREDLYITSKIWKSQYGDVEGAIKGCLQELQLDYIDLYLVHWMLPNIDMATEPLIFNKPPLHEVWKEMEGLVKKGLTKSIGVSNCTVAMLMNVLSFSEIPPAVNQVELHPYLRQEGLVATCSKFNVKVEAYAPIGAPGHQGRADKDKDLNLFGEKVIVDLSGKYGKSPAQIVLNWGLQNGHIIIPKTSNVGRLKENLQVYDFKLTEDEVKQINALDQNVRFYNLKNWEGFGFLPFFE